jgi:spore germination protein KA
MWRQMLRRLFFYEPPKHDHFILAEGSWAEEAERGGVLPPEAKQPSTRQDAKGGVKPAPDITTSPADAALERHLRKPVPLAEKLADLDSPGITSSLAANRMVLERLFHAGENSDLVIRDFTLPAPSRVGMVVYLDGIVNSDRIIVSILQPLMVLARGWNELGGRTLNLDVVEEHLMPIHQLTPVDTWDKAVQCLVDAQALVFIDGDARSLAVETRNFPSRAVGRAEVESVVRGPQEAFTESKRINVSLVRKFLRDQDLVAESVDMGEGHSAFMLYVHNVANPELVREVRKRLTGIKGDFLRESGVVEQMIEDYPNSLFPQTLTTERPDRVADSLIQGKVALLRWWCPPPCST